MALHLVNTLTGERERFEPATDDEVTIYFCGLTVSDAAHLGHARSWVHVDVLRRYLEYQGYDVRHVENFTDVNEKIVARVGERAEWSDEAAVAAHYIERTLADMRRLNLRRASAYPRVSEHLDEIIALIETLLEEGHAYVADGSVYFDVTSFDDYGRLSNQSLGELEASDDDHPEKRHPADFALWKAGGVDPGDLAEHQQADDASPSEAAAGALTWDSPWGEGRPGWHIECSAMSMAHLGETFDLHLAGRDIVFPHNENEIAQSEAATGKPYARCWVHIDLLEVDEEKMSSSLRNFFTVTDAVERFGANVVRTFLLSASHGTRQAFSEATLEEAAARWERLERAHALAEETLDGPMASSVVVDDPLRRDVEDARARVSEALDDELDTRGALVALVDLADAIRAHAGEGSGPFDYAGLLAGVDALETLGGDVLGLRFGDAPSNDRLDAIVTTVLDLREELRDAGEFDLADAVRSALADAGVEVEDTDDGPRYHLTG